MSFIKCPYCGDYAKLVIGVEIYPRLRDLHDRNYWLCRPCDAYVGTHLYKSGNIPLGRLANKELRQWKMQAHAAFDPLWGKKATLPGYTKSQARNLAYGWLAGHLGIARELCHIGMFDITLCQSVIRICKRVNI